LSVSKIELASTKNTDRTIINTSPKGALHMPKPHEMRGGVMPSFTLAAAAVLALTVESPNNNDQPVIAAPYTQVDANHVLHTFGTMYEGVYANSSSTSQLPAHIISAAHKKKKHHLTEAQIAAQEVTPEEFKAWSKVNVCEESGNWHVRGSTYSGGLGVSNENWTYYRHGEFTVSAVDATPAEQIVVAERIQKNPPDQNGCNGGW
jgi:hypothetical protein